VPGSDLFAGTYARGGAADAVDADAWVRAMVEVEVALTAACEEEGLVPPHASEAIVRAVLEPFDVNAIAADAGENATPVIALVDELRRRVAVESPEFVDAVHFGATSQDIVDTAAMLVAQRALEPTLTDARAAATAAARLAFTHRGTPMLGRTLLQPAVPTSFGLVAAGWLVALERAAVELERVRDGSLAVQMGGPVGSRAPQVAARMATIVGLAEPVIPWHTDRTRVAQLAAALGALAGVASKVARDITLLAQAEVGEVREGVDGRGGSSSMVHKRNPVAAVSVLACAKRVPGLVATIFASMEQEHQRAAGAWQAEWGTLSELLTLTGSAAAWLADLLTSLEVDAARMRENLAFLAESGVAEPGVAEPGGSDAATIGLEAQLAGAGELIDRALAKVKR
jgi:3-carboxy-cis,cis-muconate cycloisomerase